MLARMLEGKRESVKIKSSNYDTTGIVEGEVIGGNLSILYSLVGSRSLTNLQNQILFIEEVDEYLSILNDLFRTISKCESGEINIKDLLDGPVCETGFGRLN